MPTARARWAVAWPIRPKPTIPRSRPARPWPRRWVGLQPFQRPARSFPLALSGASTGHQHEHQGEISRGVCQHVRRVADRQASPVGGCQVNVVGSRPVVGDQPHHRPAGVQDALVQPIGDGRAEDVEPGHGRHEVGLGHGPVVGVDGDVVAGGEFTLDRIGPPTGQKQPEPLAHSLTIICMTPVTD